MTSLYLGDSIVAWNRHTPHPRLACPGYTTIDLYWDLMHHSEMSGDLAILSIGVNDIISAYDFEKSKSYYERIFEVLEARFSKILILSLLPTDRLDWNRSIEAYNAYLKSLGYAYCDLYEEFLDEEKKMAPKYTTDGTHLSHRGYDLLNQGLEAFISVHIHKQ